ncbi:cobalt/nickel transport system ATP-binding protein [Rhodoblastus acidophilus]|uniref:energy-coupling factor ABC transporter ATP-binding protein n=1 Tax=Rhodoblastus acidophilus TaxID=1074 RepID=UPI0022258B3F|nr:ABC transporter ATP-binding protein [Rhodoblastus acidophilus]MCW2285367.1 cobalt/nickel transport system ATP-binding protein [Rhodoblastus acidophilus]MCW2334385.1 cobalt/nickel transport system ATP-binding protein [Rhodoblastus acidophilus]
MSPLFKLDSICVSRGGRKVLNEASMEVASGERLAIAGANGAGKTTLLRTLVGLEKPSAGRLIAFGQECRAEKDFRAVRARAGFLFQDPDDQLFSPTVIEDVAFGPLNLGLSQPDALRRAEDTLARLGLTPLSRRITHRLSGGEKRLVALASVLAMRPKILLLDEPTNALDEAHRARLIEILAALDVAMVIVSHDQDFLARLTTRALLLAEGRLGRTVLHRHVHSHDHLHIHGADEDHVHPHAKAT